MQFKVHHIAIVSSNIEKSIDFYKKFGFEDFYNWKAKDNNLQILHLKLNDIILEIFAPESALAAPKDMSILTTDLQVVGTKHLGLKVESIKEAANWATKEFGITTPEIREGKTKINYFFLTDPDGNWVEIAEDKR